MRIHDYEGDGLINFSDLNTGQLFVNRAPDSEPQNTEPDESNSGLNPQDQVIFYLGLLGLGTNAYIFLSELWERIRN